MQSFGLNPKQEDEVDSSESDEDDEYIPAAEDDEYDQYGVDDDYWLEEADIGFEVNDNGEWVGSSKEAVKNVEMESGKEFENHKDMFGSAESNEEKLRPALNSDGPGLQERDNIWQRSILRKAIRERAIRDSWEVYFIINDRKRLRAICKSQDCPFELYASRMQHDESLMIKTYEPEHKCTRVFDNSMLSAKYLTKRFMERIKLNSGWKTAQTMSSEVRVRVSKQMAYQVKKAALLVLEGTIMEHKGESFPIFKRMYICLGAPENGFKARCRSVIRLDGCHLRSAYGGQLLTAVSIDANNTSWVIAYTMVEIESKDWWIWFLELLCKDLSILEDGVGWTFISDKQKGLIPAFEEVVPLAKIKFCVRYMWTNFTKLFPGKLLKDQMWRCAKSTTLPYFGKAMEEMKALDNEAYKWMTHKDRTPRHWCRTHFDTWSKCDIMINNLCESFNSFIFYARVKPPVSMFEEMRVKLMKRNQIRNDKMQAVVGNLCPKPREVLEKNKRKAASDCISTGNGGDQVEVETFEGTKNMVNLTARTCTCRMWDLSGVPCKHDVSAIYNNMVDPEDLVAVCYLKKTYINIYNNLIKSVNGMEMWTRSEEPPILPP
ncbi:uncharacterized protein LOC112202062 [Rosa chinensis]|uniref:uncharacterized protein LOC112202062 n=1 Tax=Rosa chinensis TaxID=74649 RepID=UPI000D090312|nr:uncharacterized protein LOC112202062 [Rosa chinensis]